MKIASVLARVPITHKPVVRPFWNSTSSVKMNTVPKYTTVEQYKKEVRNKEIFYLVSAIFRSKAKRKKYTL